MGKRQIQVSDESLLDAIPFHNRSRWLRCVADAWVEDIRGAHQALRQSFGAAELAELYAAANGPATRAHETDYVALTPTQRGWIDRLSWAAELTELDLDGLIAMLESGRGL